MKIIYRLRGASLLCSGTVLLLGAVRSHADPIPPTPPHTAPTRPPVTAPAYDPDWERVTAIMDEASKKRPKRAPSRTLENATLDYEGTTSTSSEVLAGKVSVKLTEAPFLAALDTVMDASAKTCRIECRHVRSTRVSLNVKDASVAGLLDTLAKMGSAHLYVLPSKLIIAPESELSKNEKKQAKPYGVLLTAATLPDVPGAKALAIGKDGSKSILDLANTKISVDIDQRSISDLFLGRLKMWANMDMADRDRYQTLLRAPMEVDDLFARVSMNLQDAKYGDVLASLAHLVGCDLYMTSKYFVICPANKFPPGTQPQMNGEPMFAALTPSSISFTDPSTEKS